MGSFSHIYTLHNLSSPVDSKMGVPEAVLEKVGSMPDVSAMSKDDLAALCNCTTDLVWFSARSSMKNTRSRRGTWDPQPGDGDQRVTRNLQDPQAEEGEQVQGHGGRTRINLTEPSEHQTVHSPPTI